jgi:hypothetical protein
MSITPIIDSAKNAVHGVQNIFNGKSPLAMITEIGNALHKQGYEISEQIGFGGISKGVHKGEGHREHRAIDVNIGSHNNEAANPAMRAKVDATAKELASKGIVVLWNHNRYQGSKVTPIAKGQDQHTDHFHVEIPKTMVAAGRSSPQGRLITTTADEKGAQQLVSNVTNINTTNVNSKGYQTTHKGRPPIPSPVIRTTDFRRNQGTAH